MNLRFCAQEILTKALEDSTAEDLSISAIYDSKGAVVVLVQCPSEAVAETVIGHVNEKEFIDSKVSRFGSHPFSLFAVVIGHRAVYRHRLRAASSSAISVC